MAKIIPRHYPLAFCQVDVSLGDRKKYINGGNLSFHHNQVGFPNRSHADSLAEDRRGILGCSTATTSRVAVDTTTSLAGRFIALLPRRNRCLSFRPVRSAGADFRDRARLLSARGCSSLLFDVGGCSHLHLYPFGTIVVAAPLFVLVCDAGSASAAREGGAAFDAVVALVPRYSWTVNLSPFRMTVLGSMCNDEGAANDHIMTSNPPDGR